MSVFAPPRTTVRSPLVVAILLATVGFITLLTEVLPAGVLPIMARDLGVSEALAGQSIAVFALGCIVAAIPLSRATRSWDRRTLIITILLVSAVANLGTALAQDIGWHLATRFVAGLVAGIVWAILPGYTRGYADPAHFGRLLSIALSGATVAMALGVPLGTLLGEQFGWRVVFTGVAALTLVFAAIAFFVAPRVPGGTGASGTGLGPALRIPAVIVVLIAVALCVVGQNMAFTYVAPVHEASGSPVSLSVLLMVFGIASVVGTLGSGRLADTALARTLVSGIIFGILGLAAISLTLAPVPLLIAAAAWGLAFGSYSVLFQVSMARIAGPAADAAQSALVTMWNISIALGGAAGGLLLAGLGTGPLFPIAAALTLLALPLAIVIGRRASASL